MVEQGLEGLLHALEGEHLGCQQVHGIGLDTGPVLQRTAERPGERSAGLGAALWALLDLGVDVSDPLLEDDVDLGASLVSRRSCAELRRTPHRR